MEITRIGDDNYDYFAELLPMPKAEPDQLLLGAIENGMPCGVLVAAFDVAAEVTWLYVAPEYRRKGAAKALIDGLKGMVTDTDIPGIMASFLPGENGLKDFFGSIDFGVFPGDPVYSISMRDFNKLPSLQSLRKFKDPGIHSISELLLREKTLFRDFLVQQVGTEAFLKDMDVTLSLVATGGTKPVGCIMVKETGPATVQVDLLLNTSSVRYTAGLLSGFSTLLEKQNKLDDTILFVIANQKIGDFLSFAVGPKKELLRKTMLLNAFWA